MRTLAFVALLLPCLLIACGKDTPAPNPAPAQAPAVAAKPVNAPAQAAPAAGSSAGTQPASAPAVASPAPPAPKKSAEVAPNPVEAAARKAADTSARVDTLVALSARVRAKHPATEARPALRKRLGAEGDFAPLLRTVYNQHGWKPALLPPPSAKDGLTGARTLLKALDELESHAVDPAPYRRDRVRTALAAYERLLEGRAEQGVGPFDDEPGRALWRAALVALRGGDRAAVAEAVAAVGPDVQVDERAVILERWLADAVVADAALEDARREADVLLTRALLRYALDFRYLRKLDPFRRPDDLVRRIDRSAERLRAHVAAAREDMAAALSALQPTHPLYERLRAALPRYRELAEKGGIERFHSPRRLRKGKKGDDVAALRERLRAEGFEPGPAGPEFDDALKAAVVAFQAVRGVAAIGEVGPQTQKALNVTMERRARQIEVSLQRWRESETAHAEGRYVRINLPRFELELWDSGAVKARHKVIVGSDRLVTSLKDETIGYLNRTRPLKSEIYQVILNPYWRVPQRIAIQEIGPAAAKDPAYLAAHGFKVVDGPGGPLYVQKPGDKNPLGRVKFLFKNDWALYLHDTDKRWLFKETRRDFSHGCVRVHNPLDLAKLLLADDRGMEEKEFKRLVRMGTEYGVMLKKKLPIYIDYITAEVADDGQLLLMQDIYRYDRDAIKGKVPSNIKRRMKSSELEKARERLRKKSEKKE